MKHPHENPDVLLHRHLRALPDQEAPSELVEAVLRRMASEKPLPWWRRPWLEWPRLPRILSVGLAAVSAEILCFSWTGLTALLQRWAAQIPGAAQLYHQSQTLVATAGHMIAPVLGSGRFPWFTVAGVALLALYLGVIGLGALFYQVVSNQTGSVK